MKGGQNPGTGEEADHAYGHMWTNFTVEGQLDQGYCCAQIIFAECMHIFPGERTYFAPAPAAGRVAARPSPSHPQEKVRGGRKGIYPASGYGCGPFSARDAYTPFEDMSLPMVHGI